MSSSRVWWLLSLAAVYVIWGSTYWAIAVMIRTVPPLTASGLRFLVAGAILMAILRARGARLPTRLEWRGAALVGVLLLTLGNGLVAFAELRVPSGLAAIVVSTMPLWAAVVGSLWGEHATRREWIALGIGFAGVVWMNAGGDLFASGPYALIILGSPIAWSIGSIAARRVRLPTGAMATAAEMLCGGAVLLAAGVVSGERVHAMPDAAAFAAWSYLVVFGSIVALTAYGYLLRTTRPAVATSYAYVNPLIAVALGMALGGEHLRLQTLLGGAVVLAGVVALSRARATRSRPLVALEREVGAGGAPVHGTSR